MAGGYESRAEGAEFFTRMFRELWAAIDTLRAANKLESAVIPSGGLQLRQNGRLSFFDEQDREIMALAQGLIDQINPDTGGRALLSQGVLRLYGDYLNESVNPAKIGVDAGADNNLLRMIPGYSDGTGGENSFTIRGRRPGQAGNAWIYCDGRTEIHGDEYNSIWGDRIEIVAGANGTGVFGTPTTSSASNVFLGTVGSQWQLARSTSSRRYKTDEAAADIDTAEVLSLSGKTWLDIYEMDNGPIGDIKRNVGFIAEELDERPSLRQFVDYDDQGRPDAIQYDRLSVALLEVAKDQQSRLDAMEARLTALEDRP